MFDSSTCFGPTGPPSGASINCVLLVWYVKIACCSERPYVRWLWNNHLTYGRSWGWTCRSETCRAVKHIVNKYSIIKILCNILFLSISIALSFHHCSVFIRSPLLCETFSQVRWLGVWFLTGVRVISLHRIIHTGSEAHTIAYPKAKEKSFP